MVIRIKNCISFGFAVVDFLIFPHYIINAGCRSSLLNRLWTAHPQVQRMLHTFRFRECYRTSLVHGLYSYIFCDQSLQLFQLISPVEVMKLAVCILLAKAQSLLWSWLSWSRPPDPSSSMFFFIEGENIKKSYKFSFACSLFILFYILSRHRC